MTTDQGEVVTGEPSPDEETEVLGAETRQFTVNGQAVEAELVAELDFDELAEMKGLVYELGGDFEADDAEIIEETSQWRLVRQPVETGTFFILYPLQEGQPARLYAISSD